MNYFNPISYVIVTVFLSSLNLVYAADHGESTDDPELQYAPALSLGAPTAIQPITANTHRQLPNSMGDKYPIGSRVAVLAGTKITGFGKLGTGFTTINIMEDYYLRELRRRGIETSATALTDILADFNYPDSLESYENVFDIVIIETPGPRNQFNKLMYQTAYNLVKPGGRIDITIHAGETPNNFIRTVRSLNPGAFRKMDMANSSLFSSVQQIKSWDSFLNGVDMNEGELTLLHYTLNFVSSENNGVLYNNIKANLLFHKFLKGVIDVVPSEDSTSDSTYFKDVEGKENEYVCYFYRKLYETLRYKKITSWQAPKELIFHSDQDHFYCSFIKTVHERP